MTSPPHPLRGLLVAQFLGAFNDNAWKTVVVLLAYRGVEATGGDHQGITTLAMSVFILPFLVFSLPAGVFADRVSKRTVIVWMKALEVVLMAAGTVALLLSPGAGVFAFTVVGLMGAQSALFGPAKYGILPEVLPHERLSAGNGLLQLWTFVAIVTGTAAAGPLLSWTGERLWIAGVVLTVLSLAGFAASFLIPRVAAARAEGGLATTIAGAHRAIRAERVLLFAIAGLVMFWTIGSLLGQNVLVYGRTNLALSDSLTAVPLAILSIGVALGSILAVRMSASKVEYGLIPMGALGLAVFVFAQGALSPGFGGTLVVMTILGVASGMLVVPLQALIQWKSPPDRRGAVIALSNVFTNGGTFLGAVVAGALASRGFATEGIFLAAGVATLAGTAWALWLLPDAFLRLIAIFLANTFYRLRIVGSSNIPQEGDALLVPNHVSFVDALFVIASTDRRVRFLVDREIYESKLFGLLLRMMRAIPISSTGGPRVVLKAMRDAGQHLDDGEVVCIFPEGQITRTGMLLPFQRGFERLVKGRSTPILPVHLDGVWGSIFSRAGGRFVWKIPRELPYPVGITIGKPLPADTPIHQVRQAMQELGAEAWCRRKPRRRPLHHSFIRRARRRPRAFAFADTKRERVSRFASLVGTVAMARALRGVWGGQETVGILLPPSVGAATVNLAAAVTGRTAVNLNYTAGAAGMTSAARQAGLETVVTSREFLEKADIEIPEGTQPIWIEEIAATIGAGARAIAFLIAALAPARLVEKACGAVRKPTMDTTAAIIFSSGSTGEPKGVCLSHFNIDANVEGAAQVFHILREDRILGVLPLFHSFGYMATLWLAVNHGLGVAFYPNPLDASAIGALIAKHRITFLVATPTFLQLYMRRCDPGQLGSLRIVLVGAEKLSERLAIAFEDRFGIRPLEGYGTTECAPVIAVSVPDYRDAGYFQPGTRRGFVGHPMPGVAVRVVDPEGPDSDLEPLPPGEAGMLLVRGPNLMQGYLGRDDLTAQVMREGWYVTGDIALVDEDGFVRITDRLSRFSKIGGEMVPHGKVEDALHEAAGVDHQIFAVTGVPDEKKGERLAVVHTADPESIPALLLKLTESGLPNLFIPRPESFVKVDALPMLGTGKIDLRSLKTIAAEALSHD